jgi:preprotein translocase subunit SecF
MKKLLVLLIIVGILILIAAINFAHAEVYVVIDKNSKAIITMGERNDTVLKPGQELKILPGDFKNYELTDHPTNYFYKNDKFVKNVAKIDAEEQAKDATLQKKEKEAQDKVKIKDKLNGLGFTDDEIVIILKE